MQLFSSAELPSRGSTETSTYGRCEVAPSGEANRKNFPSCLSKISLSFRVLNTLGTYSWWFCRVHGWYPGITELCHWLKRIISSSRFLLKRVTAYRMPEQDTLISLEKVMSPWNFAESLNSVLKDRKTWPTFSRPIIGLLVPFHFLHHWRSTAALVLVHIKNWGWGALIKPAPSLTSVRCFICRQLAKAFWLKYFLYENC